MKLIMEYINYNISHQRKCRNILVILTTREDAVCIITNSCLFCWWNNSIPSPAVNIIDYVTIASTGNAIDFGDVSYSGGDGMTYGGGCSDSHGGLGGF